MPKCSRSRNLIAFEIMTRFKRNKNDHRLIRNISVGHQVTKSYSPVFHIYGLNLIEEFCSGVCSFNQQSLFWCVFDLLFFILFFACNLALSQFDRHLYTFYDN